MEYAKLVELYEQLETTTKRLAKTNAISQLLKKIPEADLQDIVLLVQGRVFPAWDERKLGVASQLAIKALSVATGASSKEIVAKWRKTGDLGLTAQELVKGKKQRTLTHHKLTVKKVIENIQKLAATTGKGAVERKVGLIAELLTNATPIEAKYILRTVLEDLRVGVGEGALRDALVWAFCGQKLGLKYDDKTMKIEMPDRTAYKDTVEAVQHAYDVTNDFSVVASNIKKSGLKGLGKIGMVAGKPLKVMLFQKAESIEDAFSIVGKPAAFEYKYDGFRMQIHRKGKDIKIFTRRLEEVTKQFPEIAKLVAGHVKGDSYILDAEAVGYYPKTGGYRPFQDISQRIKRKYEIEHMAKELPVELNIFDILEYKGKSYLQEPFKNRRAILKKIVKPLKRQIVLAKQLVTGDKKKAEQFYKQALAKGNEGVMAKNLEAIYKPGSRVGYGVKVKPVMESLDLVIVGAEWGTGKRGGWLSSFVLACRDEGKFVEVGKVGTGIKEKAEEGVSFQQLTDLLKPHIIEEKGRVVKIKPKIVVEVIYQDLQKSPKYASGYALRFPRVAKLRPDRSPREINTCKDVIHLYKLQHKK